MHFFLRMWTLYQQMGPAYKSSRSETDIYVMLVHSSFFSELFSLSFGDKIEKAQLNYSCY